MAQNTEQKQTRDGAHPIPSYGTVRYSTVVVVAGVGEKGRILRVRGEPPFLTLVLRPHREQGMRYLVLNSSLALSSSWTLAMEEVRLDPVVVPSHLTLFIATIICTTCRCVRTLPDR